MWPPLSPDRTTLYSPLLSTVKETIFRRLLTTFEGIKRIIKEWFNDFQQSRWKMSSRTWGKIKIFPENGKENTDNF